MACLSSLVKNTIVMVSAVGSLSVITAVKVCVFVFLSSCSCSDYIATAPFMCNDTGADCLMACAVPDTPVLFAEHCTESSHTLHR